MKGEGYRDVVALVVRKENVSNTDDSDEGISSTTESLNNSISLEEDDVRSSSRKGEVARLCRLNARDRFFATIGHKTHLELADLEDLKALSNSTSEEQIISELRNHERRAVCDIPHCLVLSI